MALTKAARSKIASLVQQAKSLLMKEVEEQLQQYYGIRPDGTVLMIEQLTTADSDVIYTARLLRQRLHYLKANLADKKDAEADAVRQLVREQAFTILNRFASLRMAEERGIISETIRQEYNSEGFQVFDSITGQGQTATQYIRYKWYLYAIFDELALDLPAVFDRYSPYALVFPSEPAMNRLLAIINREDVTFHREEGLQAVNLWKEDETIGWIYQYYNSREEITAMREASGAPRNSQELAVRNQFFTPRYVVQFLSDNSLGRIWYEMTGGNTVLKTVCPYLIIRPGEIFLKKGESPPEGGAEDAQYIECRPIKDPREILMLDPACGSMHFGLYCFDLFEHIYLEAWDNYPELLTDLRNSMTRADFLKQVPELIIRHNINGVDIDPRALQIAGLSLWLRAQKSFDKQALPADQRPQITRSNLVLAEPMPGSVETLSQVVQPLEAPMRKLVLAIWDKMKLAGETGLLLKMEEEIDQTIKEIANELGEESLNTQLTIGAEEAEVQAAEKAAGYATKQYRDKFLDSAEAEVLKILKQLSETATDGDAYQKLLFAEDTTRGFAFIELCKKKYDVVLMNPPFGDSSLGSKNYIDAIYYTSKNDLASVFVTRMIDLLSTDGHIGCISTRNIFFLPTYKDWRLDQIVSPNRLKIFLDLGSGVLDAMVETSAYILSRSKHSSKSIFIRITKDRDKAQVLGKLRNDFCDKRVYLFNIENFKSISHGPFCYWVDGATQGYFKYFPSFKQAGNEAKEGLNTTDNFRFLRNTWEVLRLDVDFAKWPGYLQSDSSIRFYCSFETVVNWKANGREIKALIESQYSSYSKRVVGESVYYNEGLTWARRTSLFQPHIVPKGFIPAAGRFLGCFKDNSDILPNCSLWNSQYYDYCIKLSMERVEEPHFRNGAVNQLPWVDFSKIRDDLKEITEKQYHHVKNLFRVDDKSLAFTSNSFTRFNTLESYSQFFLGELSKAREAYDYQMKTLNELVYNHLRIDDKAREDIVELVSKATGEDDGKTFTYTKADLVHKVFTILVGCVFGKWDVRVLKHWNEDWSDEDIFKQRLHSPFLFGQYESTLDLVNPEFRPKLIEVLNQPYPIEILKDATNIDILVKRLRKVISFFWPEDSSTIESEFTDHFNVNDLSSIFEEPTRFFDAHLKDYSKNKRVSPIYWPISTTSGGYTLWLCYPNLSNQTLYKVVNDLILPKEEEVVEQVRKLEVNSHLDSKGKKDLTELREFLLELQDMEKELLAVAALSYKPNQDDGVLITAAPLHKFFKHNKWRAAAEACWKGLEKGEYDWAHLAYSIWPKRVTQKCKKDLSMAIAHGLEEICEVKPKEKKEKKAPKQSKKSTQGKLINE